MVDSEVIHRFRLVALGFAIFAVGAVAGVWINYGQTQDIKHQASALRVEAVAIRQNAETIRRNTEGLLRRDCQIVYGTAGVFVDFIRKEIALRTARAKRPDTAPGVRNFDKAEVAYWSKVTLPKLGQAFQLHCNTIDLTAKPQSGG